MTNLENLDKSQLLGRLALIGQQLATAYGRDKRSERLIEASLELATGESQAEFMERLLREGKY